MNFLEEVFWVILQGRTKEFYYTAMNGSLLKYTLCYYFIVLFETSKKFLYVCETHYSLFSIKNTGFNINSSFTG